jgi:hypothetical protein
MNSVKLAITFPNKFDISSIQNEVRQLVERGRVSRHQPIYVLCQYLPAREWMHFESELEKADYLLRDPIGDLLFSEDWSDD